jgi:hypothetical protein
MKLRPLLLYFFGALELFVDFSRKRHIFLTILLTFDLFVFSSSGGGQHSEAETSASGRSTSSARVQGNNTLAFFLHVQSPHRRTPRRLSPQIPGIPPPPLLLFKRVGVRVSLFRFNQKHAKRSEKDAKTNSKQARGSELSKTK